MPYTWSRTPGAGHSCLYAPWYPIQTRLRVCALVSLPWYGTPGVRHRWGTASLGCGIAEVRYRWGAVSLGCGIPGILAGARIASRYGFSEPVSLVRYRHKGWGTDISYPEGDGGVVIKEVVEWTHGHVVSRRCLLDGPAAGGCGYVTTRLRNRRYQIKCRWRFAL